MSKQPEALFHIDWLSKSSVIGAKQAGAELRRLHEVNKEWERKAATWLASPEASARLEGYLILAQRVNEIEAMNQELVEALQVIRHGAKQARIIGNDWRCELNLCENIANETLAKAGESA